MRPGTTILERGVYAPKFRCEGGPDHPPCDWYRRTGKHAVCFYRGEVRRTLEPGAVADFCEHHWSNGGEDHG